MKRVMLAVAVILAVGAAGIAEARGRRCGSCCGGGCATACESGCPTPKKETAATDAAKDKAQVAKEQAPPSPVEEKTADAKKASNSTATASESYGTRRRMGRRRS